MQSFTWGPSYLTGLETVDQQHHHLVDLINAVGRSLSETGGRQRRVPPLLDELADYAHYHFTEEEQLMREAGLDTRFVEPHVGAHRDFLAEVRAMQAETSADPAGGLRQLMDFLTHWLTYHILGSDQQMAEQMRAIDAGHSAGEAFDALNRDVDPATGPLLAALNGLFELVSARNRALQDLNRSLERKVEERTRELARANEHLEQLALTDTLTGLSNRRHAMQQLELMWEEASRTNGDLACMLLDADRFKEVNDTHGHEAGDEVLTHLARTLRHAVRTDDLVCRLGGDEFLILCPDTDEPGAVQAAQQVLEAVHALRVPTGDGCWRGSASIGVAARSSAMRGTDGLIKAADEAVYAAKRSGRNCVRSGDG